MKKKENEYTVIVGCGRLGASIAGKLSDQKKDVMILDCDKTAFRKLPYSYGGLTMTANATDIEKLTAAGVKDATVFLAVTDRDCVNICAAQIAKKVFHIPKVVARIYDQDKKALMENMGIDMICPSELSQKEISNYIEIGGVKHVG
ncbi:hypothetical protein BHF69_09125 [Anaerostipes sp. 992a]|uniref:NAD-binding protein n=1 Tax=Anaerostipes sp. 992a TaxID=1261637 RepID=UPI000952DDF7|nr:NAD-binding protein [Anaerostipes sp. 992a]MDD5969821.1 NAD-binding protein [Anaerostipes sp.]OLR62827.1 hypothetical protein BHF69_09125 [Anaerostipes sp. 992a]